MTLIDTNKNEGFLLSLYFKLGNVLGLFPLIPASKKLKWFFWCYISALYTTLEVIAVTALIEETKYEIKGQTFNIFMQAYFIFLICFMIIGIYGCANQETNWRKLMGNIARIDDVLRRRICFGESGFITKILIATFCYVLLTSLIIYENLTTGWFLPRILKEALSLLRLLLENQGYFLTINIYQISSIIRKRYDYLNDIVDAIENELMRTVDANVKIQEIKRLCRLLHESVGNFNTIFGGYFLWFFSDLLLMLVWTCEGFLNGRVFRNSSEQWCNSLYLVIQNLYFLIMIMSCDKVEKSAQKLLKTSHYLRVEMNDPTIRAELLHLSEFIEELLPEFSALGFFRINQRLIPALLSSMTSYVIVLIQFKNT